MDVYVLFYISYIYFFSVFSPLDVYIFFPLVEILKRPETTMRQLFAHAFPPMVKIDKLVGKAFCHIFIFEYRD